jgi:hypothetical protein
MRAAIALAVVGVAATPLFAQPADAPFVVAERNEAYQSLQEAVDAIGAGQGTIVIAPGRYKDCAVQKAGRIAFVAATPGTAIFRGGICEGKATLVLRGRSARVEGLVFEKLSVPEGNAAGIRMEKGDLWISQSLFRDSEMGLLSANDPNGTISVDRSTFSRLGRCRGDGTCSHSFYVGDFGAVSITRTRFERGTGGHYLKSRAPRIEVTDSSFDDSGGSETSYLIDLPHGALGRISGNIFVQGKDKENHAALIMIGWEGAKNSSDGFLITGNEASIAPGQKHPTSFVADFSGDRLRIENNRLGPRVTRFERR